MMGRIVGGVLGTAISRQRRKHPVAGAVIGAGAMFAARRLFPQRYAFLAATAAAGYLTKKWAESAEQRKLAEAAHDADAAIVAADVVDPFAGVGDTPADGASIGDALPPAIPHGANSSAIH